MKLTKDRRPYERVRLRGRRRKWNGKGAGGAGRRGNQGREIREKGEGLLFPFPSHAFSRNPPPPSSPLPLFSCHATTKLCFSHKNYCFERGGRSRESGGESEMAPYPLSLSRFSPPPPSVFSPVTQLLKSVSVKLLLRRGGRSRKGVGGREGNGSLCLFAFAFFSILPFSFSTCHAASKES